MQQNEQPGSYEEALALGFQPIDDIETFLSESVGIEAKGFRSESLEAAEAGRIRDCSTVPPGTPCFDFCYSNGVRVMAFCGPTHQCDRFVQGTCTPG
jgi:hypothetical protein